MPYIQGHVLATQVLRQVTDDYYTEFQQAAEFVCRNFYVDDCLTGVSSLQEATVIRESLNQLLGKACMTHQKWRSNSRDLLATVPDDLKEKENIQLIVAPRECRKALGVHWHTVEDTLHVATPSLQPDDLPTKRQVASDVARTFDILGWFAPAIVTIKLLLQKLWQLQLDWDHLVPNDITQDWRTWREELPLLTDHAIPRCYYSRSKKRLSTQLHGFCDASQLA